MFWSNEPVRTLVLKSRDVLSVYRSPSADGIPAALVDPDGYWTGFSARLRVIAYNTKLVKAEEAPRSIFDLADPKWRGQVAIADPRFGSTSFHVAALYAVAGDQKMDDFFQRLKENGVRIVDGNSVVRDLVARGDVKIGLTDTDDVNVAVEDGQPLAMVLPDTGGVGVPVVPNMVSLIANAPHVDEGRRLIDYLLSADVERQLAQSEAVQIALDSRQRGLLNNTAILGVGTATLTTIVGAPLGIVLARVPLLRKGLVRVLTGAPLLLPPYVVALAWVHFGSTRGPLAPIVGAEAASAWTYSLPAAILILSLVLYPLPMLSTEVALRRVDGRLEEAALTAAPARRVVWHITLPLVAPSILAAALLVFVLAVSEFSVPGLLRVRVYATEVFTAFAALYDFSRAVALAIPLLVLCVAVAAAAAWLLVDRLVTACRSVGASPIVFGAWRHDGRLICLGDWRQGVVLGWPGARVEPFVLRPKEPADIPRIAEIADDSKKALTSL